MRELEIYVGEGERRQRRRRGKWLLPLLAGIVAAVFLTREKAQTPPRPYVVASNVPPKIAPAVTPPAAATSAPPAVVTPVATEPPPARIVVIPPQLDFGDLIPPRTAPAQILTIRNDGGAPSPPVRVAVRGPFLATNGCANAIAPGAQCAIAVVFAPPKPGSFNGLMTAASETGQVQVTLRGTLRPAVVTHPAVVQLPPAVVQAVTPKPQPQPAAAQQPPPPRVLCFDPPAIHFVTTGRQTITLTNPGPLPLRVVAILPVGQQGETISGYEVDPGRCLRDLPPGKQCRFSVRANQLALQRRETMRLTVYYDDPLTGTRRAADVSSACR